MRIIDINKVVNCDTHFDTDQLAAVIKSTIEITDDELDEICNKYVICTNKFNLIGFKYGTFSEYLKQLISLKVSK